MTTFCRRRDSNECLAQLVCRITKFFSMRYLLFAIAAIAAAQIAFQSLVVDDYAPEYSASVAPGAWRPDTIVTVRGEPKVVDSKPVQPAITRVRHRRPATRRSEPVLATYRLPQRRVSPTLTAKVPARRPPRRFPRPDGPVRTDDDDDKPWIAKALPIVKKPYSWLKALGAKLK